MNNGYFTLFYLEKESFIPKLFLFIPIEFWNVFKIFNFSNQRLLLDTKSKILNLRFDVFYIAILG